MQQNVYLRHRTYKFSEYLQHTAARLMPIQVHKVKHTNTWSKWWQFTGSNKKTHTFAYWYSIMFSIFCWMTPQIRHTLPISSFKMKECSQSSSSFSTSSSDEGLKGASYRHWKLQLIYRLLVKKWKCNWCQMWWQVALDD